MGVHDTGNFADHLSTEEKHNTMRGWAEHLRVGLVAAALRAGGLLDDAEVRRVTMPILVTPQEEAA